VVVEDRLPARMGVIETLRGSGVQKKVLVDEIHGAILARV